MNKDPVEVKCDICGTLFFTTYDSYRTGYKKPNHIARCNECRKIRNAEILANELSDPIKKKIRYNKVSKTKKNQWSNMDRIIRKKRIRILQKGRKKYQDNLSLQDKEKLSKDGKDWYNSQSEEYKENNRLKSQNTAINWWRTASVRKKKNRNKKLAENWKNKSIEDKEYQMRGINKYNENLTDEEKNEKKKKLVDIHSLWFKSLTKKQKKNHNKKISKGHKNFWKNASDEVIEISSKRTKDIWNSLSNEEKDRRGRILELEGKKFWNSASKERKDNRLKKLHEGRTNWWNNLTLEEYKKWKSNNTKGYNKYYNNLGIIPNKNESNFINDLNKHGIIYQHHWISNIKHKDFNKLFLYNPITEGSSNSTKEWDFIIYTKQGNILVDIDGSMHTEKNMLIEERNGVIYKSIDNIQFKDSQRPYQTDGLDAYIIECYNDKLEDDTRVLHVKNNKPMEESNEYISFKEFMNMIQLMNYSNKELREILY